MRGTVEGLQSPFPLLHQVPGIFQDDDFMQRFLSGLDTVIAPLVSTLDNLSAIVDPELAPEDLLDWLGHWVAVPPSYLDGVDERRLLVGNAVMRHRRRGTLGAVVETVRLLGGAEIRAEETGAVTTSPHSSRAQRVPTRPTTEPSAKDVAPQLRLRVTAHASRRERITDAVMQMVPVGVRVSIEFDGAEQTDGTIQVAR